MSNSQWFRQITSCRSKRVLRSSIPTDPVLLNLLSTYLLYYALVLASCPEIANPDSIQELSTTLHLFSTHSVLSWILGFYPLPMKHLDSLLMQAYVPLTPLPQPSLENLCPRWYLRLHWLTLHLLHLRIYALRCLAYASPGIIEGSTFWGQATKFVSLFVRATTTSFILEEYATVILASLLSRLQKCEMRKKYSWRWMETTGNFLVTIGRQLQRESVASITISSLQFMIRI